MSVNRRGPQDTRLIMMPAPTVYLSRPEPAMRVERMRSYSIRESIRRRRLEDRKRTPVLTGGKNPVSCLETGIGNFGLEA